MKIAKGLAFITIITFITVINSQPVFAQVRRGASSDSDAPTETSEVGATEQTTSRLQQLVEAEPGPLSPATFLQHALQRAVAQGVPADAIVLLLLFPVVASLIATARHLLGLRGFGIFTPAMMSITFLATGLRLGMALVLLILAVAMTARLVIRRLRLQYMPQMAMLILAMSLGILGLLIIAPSAGEIGGLGGFWGWLRMGNVAQIGIFPILLLVILTENFISAFIAHGARVGARMTAETLALATVSYLLMSLRPIQEWVVVHPEWTVALLAGANVLLGRYTGLRLLEYWRFRELLRR